MHASRRRVVIIAAAALLGASLASPAAAGPGQEGVAVDDVKPVAEDRDRGFVEAAPGEVGPPLPFPGEAATSRSNARSQLAEFDRAAADAMQRADDEYRRSGRVTAVGRPAPAGRDGKPTRVQVPHLPAGPAGAAPSGAAPSGAAPSGAAPSSAAPSGAALAGCVGNCYQTDALWLSDPGNDIYAMEYNVWLALPQTNEYNRCDSTTAPDPCFWFLAMYASMNSAPYSSSGMHIGPQRGVSLAGDAGSNWRMNIDGYISGSHIGGQSSTNLPVATWIRVRVWRTAFGTNASAPYKPWSTWGVWALWGGVDRYLGSLTIDGHTMIDFTLFSEVNEQLNQCSTDLERGYLSAPRYWRVGAAQAAFADAWAHYEANCPNTSWNIVSNQFLSDERETTRTVAENQLVW